MAGRCAIPFYDRDGDHWMTVEIELDDAGQPPPRVELAGPRAGQGIRCQFHREHRAASDPPWAYVEISRTWRGEPIPGSPEALQRLLESEDWPRR
jgi:hypothetical protein